MNILYLDEKNAYERSFDANERIVSFDAFYKRYARFIVTEPEEIAYRQELFADLMKNRDLYGFFSELTEKYERLSSFRNSKEAGASASNEKLIFSLIYPKYYVELVCFINEAEEKFGSLIRSRALTELFRRAREDRSSSKFNEIRKNLERSGNDLLSVKSIAVGINLTPDFKPKEAGLIAVSSGEYRSGNIIDRLIRLDFSRDDFHAMAPLTDIDKRLGYDESQRLNFSVLKAFEKVFRDSLSSCSSGIVAYLKEKLEKYYTFLYGLDFIKDSLDFIERLNSKGSPSAFPSVSPNGAYKISSLYDATLILSSDAGKVSPNNVLFNGKTCCYILSGPNSGGKSVFLNSLGCAQFIFQLGLPIPALNAEMPVCDRIYYMSAQNLGATGGYGRFETECMTMAETIKSASVNSLVLIDEFFTSTTSEAAVPVAANSLKKLSSKGVKCVFITHIYELYDNIDEYAESTGLIGYLHTDGSMGRRDYKIKAGKYDFISDANIIARKYGLD